MKNKTLQLSLLSVLCSTLLIGCGSTNSTNTTPTPYPCQTNQQQTDDLRIYQVMVESFVNGDSNIGHGTGYGTSHHNGDLQGIIDSLDYIKSLGMNAIWLTPVFESTPIAGQDHWKDRLDATGYFATNFFKIDPNFGDMEKAKELVDLAHAKGLYVFFDGVFGHHKENVVPSPTGKMPVGKSNPVSYPESLPFFKEVAEFWVKELKIDGWRLDQAYQVPTDAWAEIRKAVDEASLEVTYTNQQGETVHPLGYMVAEIWNNENYIAETGYGTKDNPALCSAFDFPVRYRMVETFAVNENGISRDAGGKWLDEGMRLHSLYPPHAKPNLMLGNHDLVRFGDLLQRGKIAEPEDAEYWQRHKAIFSFQAAYTGPITFYYGEEIGDEVENFADKQPNDTCAIKGWCDDHVARSSAKIEGVTSDTLNAQQQDLKQYLASLMAMRSDHPSLSNGVRTNIRATQDIYIDHKQSKDDVVVYVVSTSTDPQQVTLSAEEIGSLGNVKELLSEKEITLASGNYTFNLNPFEAMFLQVTQPSNNGPIANTALMAAATVQSDSFLAQCDNPTIDEQGPINQNLYVVGDFSDSNWKAKPQRKFEYKGDGIYQVVVEEKQGSYKMQYASASWKPQFTADGLQLTQGVESDLVFGGYGKDTAVSIIDKGNYVWSLSFSDAGKPKNIMLSKCK